MCPWTASNPPGTLAWDIFNKECHYVLVDITAPLRQNPLSLTVTMPIQGAGTDEALEREL